MKIVFAIIAVLILLPCMAEAGFFSGGGGGSSSVSSGGKVCKTITNPSTADTHLLLDIVQSNRTITKVSGISYGGTSAAFKLYDAGTGAGNTEINSTAVTAATTVTDSSALTYAIHAGDAIYLGVTAVTGVVTQLMVCYE